MNGRTVVRWDKILPHCSLRVLIEHDDSTCQVVTALLRKCGYHGLILNAVEKSGLDSIVSLFLTPHRMKATVADGMKAWEVMQECAYAFNLVLTEVAMPTLSGIQLLARIIAADECQNTPIISWCPFPNKAKDEDYGSSQSSESYTSNSSS